MSCLHETARDTSDSSNARANCRRTGPAPASPVAAGGPPRHTRHAAAAAVLGRRLLLLAGTLRRHGAVRLVSGETSRSGTVGDSERRTHRRAFPANQQPMIFQGSVKTTSCRPGRNGAAPSRRSLASRPPTSCATSQAKRCPSACAGSRSATISSRRRRACASTRTPRARTRRRGTRCRTIGRWVFSCVS